LAERAEQIPLIAYSLTARVYRLHVMVAKSTESQTTDKFTSFFTLTQAYILNQIFLLPPTKEEVNVFVRVYLFVCLLARLLKNACMDLDEMLRVDRCRDMDELINF